MFEKLNPAERHALVGKFRSSYTALAYERDALAADPKATCCPGQTWEQTVVLIDEVQALTDEVLSS